MKGWWLALAWVLPGGFIVLGAVLLWREYRRERQQPWRHVLVAQFKALPNVIVRMRAFRRDRVERFKERLHRSA